MLDNIEVFTQSSIRITNNSSIIYADPFLIKKDSHDADYVLITHAHYDHFSIDDIRKVRTSCWTYVLVYFFVKRKFCEKVYLIHNYYQLPVTYIF